jgi:solute carrier family 35 protein E1
VVYNVTNKRVLNYIPLPASIATLQLFIGIPLFVIPLWFSNAGLMDSLRAQYLFSQSQFWKIAFFHGLGNIATTYSLGAGAVSFTHVVKAAEPIFSAGLSAVILKSYLSLRTCLCLIPIVLGVGLASLAEITFTWFGFSTALLSNLLYQLRNVYSKLELSKHDAVPHKSEPAPTSVELFRAITIMGATLMLPVALILEGHLFEKSMNELLLHSSTDIRRELFINTVVSGISYYLYNEVAFRILNKVSPTTHAIGNTIKRLVIIAASAVFLGTTLTWEGMAASSVAVIGTFLYSLSTSAGSASGSKARQVNFG